MNQNEPKREDFSPHHEKEIEKLNLLRADALARKRHFPTKEELLQRRNRLKFFKWALPSFAGFLLISITAWPEISHLIHQNNRILEEMRRLHFETGHIEHAVYRNNDDNGNPYVITAQIAHQVTPNRVNMVNPEADILLNQKTWFHVRADTGTYFQRQKNMFLKGHVVFYRQDGLLLNSPTAEMDLSKAIIASSDWVHSEGPLGIENAEGMFFDEKNNILQFLGVGRSDIFDDKNPSSSKKDDIQTETTSR